MAYTQYPSRDRQMISTFYGLDKGKRIRDGAWNDMLNMTCDDYPVASVRDKRKLLYKKSGDPLLYGGITSATNNSDGLISRIITAHQSGNFAHVTLTYENNLMETVSITPTSFSSYSIQKVLNFGRNTFVYPAMKYIEWGDTRETTVVHDTNVSVSGFTFVMTDIDAVNLNIQTGQKPVDPSNGDIWYDASVNGLYKYSEAKDEWVAFAASYIKLMPTANNAEDFKRFVQSIKEGQAIRIKNADHGAFNTSFIVSKIALSSVSAANQYILVNGLVMGATPLDTQDAIIERRAPIFDFAIEHRNRIWGCRYGDNDDGEFVNEIYGSALGDCLDYFRYEGTAADSFTASVGTGTNWSGIGVIDDYVIFFKEDRYYILSGAEPPFRIREVQAEGVQIGSDRSVCNIGGCLYYKSNHGVMRMRTDTLPVCVSEDLGADVYGYARAGTDGKKYYIQTLINAMRPTEEVKFFVYDTRKSLWTEEKSPSFYINAFLREENNLLAVGYHEGETYDIFDGEFISFENKEAYPVVNIAGLHLNSKDETEFEWHAETGLLGLGDPDEKIARMIQVRAKTAYGARLRCEISYDDSDEWTQIYNEIREATTTHVISHKPGVRCDTFRLRFSGVGACDIYSITITTEGAGDNVHY